MRYGPPTPTLPVGTKGFGIAVHNGFDGGALERRRSSTGVIVLDPQGDSARPGRRQDSCRGNRPPRCNGDVRATRRMNQCQEQKATVGLAKPGPGKKIGSKTNPIPTLAETLEVLRQLGLEDRTVPSVLEDFIDRHVGSDRQLTLRLV